jgi:hypothetical protein
VNAPAVQLDPEVLGRAPSERDQSHKDKRGTKMTAIGYTRVSTTDQDLTVQIQALKAAGCQMIRKEKASGATTKGRVELAAILDFIREGDRVVTRIDRLARSIADHQDIVRTLKARGAALRAGSHGDCAATQDRKGVRLPCDVSSPSDSGGKADIRAPALRAISRQMAPQQIRRRFRPSSVQTSGVDDKVTARRAPQRGRAGP